MKPRVVQSALFLFAAFLVMGARTPVNPNEPGKLGGYIAVGSSPDYLKQWLVPGSPTVPLVESFHVGETAYIGFIVTGMLPDANGQVNVTVDYRITRPDGSVMFEQREYAKVVGHGSNQPNFVIADGALDLSFDSSDTLGKYSVAAVFHDAVSKQAAVSEASIELVGKKAATTGAEEPALSFEATDDRMTHFYTRPSAEEFEIIERSIKANLSSLESKNNGASTLAIVFLARVHEKFGYPLMDIGTLDNSALSLSSKDGSTVSTYVYDDSQLDPGKLDIWWVSFFATGETLYLDKVFAVVGKLEEQSGAQNILVTGAANWSVASNCWQHPVVLDYLKLVLTRDPPVPNAEALRAILSKLKGHDG